MDWLQNFREIVQTNVPLGMYTWFQLGGAAEFFAEPRSVEELAALVRACHEAAMPVKVLGNGSNVLVRSGIVSGLVLRFADRVPCLLEVDAEQRRLRVGGNVPLSRLITTAVGAGLGGLEDLIGIPGTVGGALHGNAGTDTADVGEFLRAAKVLTMDGSMATREGAELVFGYRQSSLEDCLVLEAEFELHEESPIDLAARMQKQWIVRKSLQPMGHQCAGRIFKNPTDGGMNASEIIHSCGLRKLHCGGAAISERHANFIIAEPTCTADDIMNLIDQIRDGVFQKTGTELDLEIEIW